MKKQKEVGINLRKESTLAYRHGIKGCYYLWAGQGLQSVLQSLQVDTLFRVVRCVYQHGQAVLHAGQLGGNYCKVLEKEENIFKMLCIRNARF